MADPAPGLSPEDDLLAAEYALGVLDAPEHDAAKARANHEDAFNEAAQAWSTRLGAIAEEAAPQRPPPGIWSRMAGRLTGETLEFRLRRRVAGWRAAACTAGAIAACLALVLLAPRHNEVQTARLTGEQGGRYVYVIVYDPGRREAVFTAADQPGIAGRTPQLWSLPPGGKPISLGIAPDGRVTSLVVDPRQAGPGRTLAVSLEPRGGSPTGQPTGPVVATGALSPI